MTERVGIEVFVDPRRAQAGAKKANQSLNSLERQAEQTDRKFKTLGAGASKLGVALGSIVSVAALGGLAKGIIDVDAKFQRLNASLETVTGSSLAAQAAFAQISDFAKTTPFSLEQVVESFIKLKALGLAPSERALTSYGNTASAMGKSLNQLIEAVADAATGEFERLKEFGIKSKQQGDSVAFTFRGLTTTVQKDAGSIQEYLLKLGEAEFAGGMERQMKTIGAAITNMGDEWELLQKRVSDSGFGEAVEEQVRDVTAFIAALDSEAIDDFAGAAELAAKAVAAFLVVRKIGPIFGANTAEIKANTASLVANAAAATKATIQTNALGQVISRTTVITRASTLATRAATGAMALLGGPVGVAMVGALAVYELSKAFDDTEDKARAAKGEIDGFARSLANMNDTQRQTNLQNLTADLNDNLRTQASIQERLNELTGKTSGVGIQRNKLQAALNGLKERELALSEKQQAAFNSRMPNFDEGVVSSAKAASAELSGAGDNLQARVDEAILSLKQQLAEDSGNGSVLASIRFEIDQGSLQGVSDQAAKTLEGLAGQIDARAALVKLVEEEGRAAQQAAANLASLEQELLSPVERVNQVYQNRIEIIRNAGLEESRSIELTAKVAAQKSEELKALKDQEVVGFDAIFGRGTLDNLFSDFNNIEENFKGLLLRMVAEAAQAQILQSFGMSSGGKSSFTDIFASVAGSFAGGKANGGRFQKNQMFEVNERGPELATIGNKQFLMTNGSSGNVTPNEQIKQSSTRIVNAPITIIAPNPATFSKAQRQISVDLKRRLG